MLVQGMNPWPVIPYAAGLLLWTLVLMMLA